MTVPPEEGTRSVVCAKCNFDNRIGEPADDAWDAITEPDLTLPGRQQKITGWRVVFKCTNCGSRTAIVREADSQ